MAGWQRFEVMGGSGYRRAVQVVAGEFLGSNGDLDVIATFHGVASPWTYGSIYSAYDYAWDLTPDVTWDIAAVEAPVTAAAGLSVGNVDGITGDEVIATAWEDSPDGFIAWYKWDDVNEEWDKTTVTDDLDKPLNTLVHDVDGDSDGDIIATIYAEESPHSVPGLLAWFENTKGDGSEWEQHEIDWIEHPYAIAVENLDLDFYPDIVITTTDLQNLDSEGVFIYHGQSSSPWFDSYPEEVYFNSSPTQSLQSPRSIRIENFNDDGFQDLVAAFAGNQENTPPTGYDIVVAIADPDGMGGIDWDFESANPDFVTCRDTYPVDMNDDELMDFAASGLYANGIYWFENTGDDEDRWEQHNIGDCNLAKGIVVGDFGGSYAPDIGAASYHTTGDPDYESYVYQYTWIYTGREDFAPENPLSLSSRSSAALDGDLDYDYSFTLEDTSDVDLYAWYSVVLPDRRVIRHTPVDTLGTLPGTYTGSGSISIPDSLFNVGDRCQLFISVGYDVEVDAEEPTPWLHAHYTESKWIDVVSAAEIDRGSGAGISSSGFIGIENIQPNPFNPTTSFVVSLPDAAMLHVAVYNILGQQVALLSDGSQVVGRHTFTFDGSEFASGLYFVHVSVPDQYDEIRKITLLK